jgi:protoporphyrinogen oxidase
LCLPAPRRGYAAGPPRPPPKDIAVIGGGLTGITTAYYLGRWMPQARITLYEANDRLGGWVHTDRRAVADGEGREGVVLFERGPRVVQPTTARGQFDDLVLYELAGQLGLGGSMRAVSAVHWAKLRRYVFYPDHLVAIPRKIVWDLSLQGLPAEAAQLWRTVQDMWSEPVFAGVMQAMLARWRDVELSLPAGQRDVSMGAFFAHFLGGRELVDNLLSAMVHGIYGGDVWKISMESSLFGRFFEANVRRGDEPGQAHDPQTYDLMKPADVGFGLEMMGDSDVVTNAKNSVHRGGIAIPGGFSALTDAMVNRLKAQSNVQFKTGSAGRIRELRYDASEDKVKVSSLCAHQPLPLPSPTIL